MSTKNMAKRTAAGTLALAVCLGGGALAFAGAAQAADPITATTPSTDDHAVAAPSVIRSTGQSVSDITVALSKRSWATGDRVVVQLPANVAWNGTPSVKAVKVSGSGTVAPTFDVAKSASTDDPTTTIAGSDAPDAVAAVRRLTITFTNSQGTTSTDTSTAWKLVVSGLKVDVSSDFASDSIILGKDKTHSSTTSEEGKVYGETYDANGGTYKAWELLSDKSVLGYVQTGSISVADGYSFVNGGGVQAAPKVTITEALAKAWSDGAISFGFVDAKGNNVLLDASKLAIDEDSTFAPTLSVNGETIESGSFTTTALTTEASDLSTPSITVTKSIDKVVIGNLRFTGSAYDSDTNTTVPAVGPVKAVLLDPAAKDAGAAGFAPTSGDITIGDPNARLGGATRFDTAAQIAAYAHPQKSYSNFVLAAGDGSGVDALAANYVGGVGQDRPVLLTAKTWLPDSTLAFLKSKVEVPTSGHTTQVSFVVLGGKAAIDDSVLGQIKDAFPSSQGYNVVINRWAGDDRYETAAAAAINVGSGGVASFSNTYGKPAVRTALLASGENPADAVTAGGIAYGGGFPLLLTASGSLPSATVNALQTLEIKQVIIVGGPKAISTAVEDKLKGMGISVIRKYGDDRFGTALQIAEFARTPVASTNTKEDAGLGWNDALYSSEGTKWKDTSAVLGNGYGFADLLAAGQLSAQTVEVDDNGTPNDPTDDIVLSRAYRPLLTTDGATLTDSTKKWLVDHKASISGVTGVGGSSAVSWDALTAAVNAQK